jgi:hypothetical protein
MSDESKDLPKEISVPADPVARRQRKSEAAAERGVPERLRLTPERRRKAAEFQAAQAASRARLTPSEMRRENALSRRAAVFANMAALWLAHDAAEAAGDRTETARILSDIATTANAYAEILFELGEFKDAAGWHTSPARAREMREYARAEKLDDAERCACPDTPALVDGRTKLISPRYTEAVVYSQRYGGEVHAVRCNNAECRHLNVRPSTGRLERQRAAQEGASRAARRGERVEAAPNSEAVRL